MGSFGTRSSAEQVTDSGRETSLFLGDDNSSMFVVYHTPAEPNGAGVVICQSILGDFTANYRREVVIARELASLGIGVARFHYRGCGHSTGASETVTFGSMCDDTREIAAHFQTTLQLDRIGFLGTRWGAMVAACAAASYPEAPIAMWEPSLSAKEFFKEGFRAQQMAALVAREATPTRPQDALREDGVTDVLGYALRRVLFESVPDIGLGEMVSATSGPILFVGRQHAGQPAKREAKVIDAMRDRGLEVDYASDTGPEAWWFIDEEQATPTQPDEGTSRWLVERLADRR